MRIASLLVGLALVAEAACTRPTPGYCGDDRGGADNGKCGTGLTCNRVTLLCDRPDAAVVVVVDGGADATPSDAQDGGADAREGGDGGDGGGTDAVVVVTCDGPEDCGAGRSCVDGICCASPSCGRCESCAIPGFEGTCKAVPQFTDDPNSLCSGDVTCDGFGGCLLKQGKACARATDCASLICTDGVCCERACTETCFSCNQAAGLGTCSPINGAEDANATPACSGTRTCVTPAGGTPACKLKDGQTCTAAADCANGTCLTSYPDADMDGFGANTNTPAKRCEVVPQSGYLTTSGDCCDSDPNTRPSQTTPSAVMNACNSYDRNCDNRAERTSTVTYCGCMTVLNMTTCGTCI